MGNDLSRLQRLAAALCAGLALVVGSCAALWGPLPVGELVLVGTLAAAPWAVVRFQPTTAPTRLVWACWPLLVWASLYEPVTRVVQLRAFRIDPLLARVDAWLLGPPDWPLGGHAAELANLFYASWYAIVPGTAIWLWRRHGEEPALRYALGVLAAFAACVGVWLLLPAGGHHPTGSPTAPGWGPATGFVRSVYAAHPHHAAAFPSSHVALAVVCATTLLQVEGRAWPALWAVGVAWSTVYGQYHYSLDGAAGVLVGLTAARVALRTPGLAPDALSNLVRRFLDANPPEEG